MENIIIAISISIVLAIFVSFLVGLVLIDRKFNKIERLRIEQKWNL